MEEVLEKLSKTKFNGLYKNNDRSLENQEERRNEMLRLQKTNRSVRADTFRGVLGLVETVQQRYELQAKRPTYKPQIYVAGFNKCKYQKVLMQSEWLVERPKDFHENWYVVPCPKGIRTLVVASQGKTKLYSKAGDLIKVCQTALPGGSYGTAGSNRCCILDGFTLLDTNTILVLDLLAWNSHIMTDGETEFRNYWMMVHFDQIPNLLKLNKENEMMFKLLPKVTCDRDNFEEFMMQNPQFPKFYPQLDGLLFYHKNAHYVSGETPLMGWLYPFMVPEVLGADIRINLGYVLDRPVNYVNQAEFIMKFSRKKEKRCHVSQMDTSPLVDENDLLVVETLAGSGAFDPDDDEEGNEASALRMN